MDEGLLPKGVRLRSVWSVLVMAVLVGPAALAQTQLVASNPQTGAVIARHDVMFRLRFNKRIENAECSISLQMPTGQQRTLPLEPQSASDEIEASGSGLGAGAYVLSWQTQPPGELVTRGTVSFNVR